MNMHIRNGIFISLVIVISMYFHHSQDGYPLEDKLPLPPSQASSALLTISSITRSYGLPRSFLQFFPLRTHKMYNQSSKHLYNLYYD